MPRPALPDAHRNAARGDASAVLRVQDVGEIDYASGLDLQRRVHAEVLAGRDEPGPAVGQLLLLEHVPPVITVSRRPAAREHLLASPGKLTRLGVTVAETDRGGDITYHGPGQLVAYPILDLNRLGLNLHAYLRFLEGVIIETCEAFGVAAHRDECATGVWVGGHEAGASASGATAGCTSGGERKIAAIGVRVRKWISLHGLALNVTTNLDHFGLIVPCGLAGRQVTSLERELGLDACPSLAAVKAQLANRFEARVREQSQAPCMKRRDPSVMSRF